MDEYKGVIINDFDGMGMGLGMDGDAGCRSLSGACVEYHVSAL